MGYERKRGKLADLNWLLRAGPNADTGDRFSLVVGETAILANVKYVITLDTDTQLARDSAWQFVGAMAHPLNRARYDEDKQRVCEGYGILQPRVAVSLPGANRSRYARMCGSDPGIDPYTRAVSDVYQDLFGEGSFIGKGIYDVDAFERATGRAFPRQPDPQPRSFGRVLRAGRAVERCAVVRGIPVSLQRGREPPAPLDSRGLADCAVGDAGRSRPRCAPSEESALDAVPLEDLRQPAAQSRTRGFDTPVAAGLDSAAVGLVLDLVGDGNHPDSFFDQLCPGC